MLKLEPLPPEEAIKFFEQKGLVLSERWDEIWQEMHAKAFTVAGVMRLDVLADIYEQIEKAIAKGTTLADFKKDFKEIMKRRGWYDPKFKRPWRLETIFRTNVQTAYQAGRYKQQKEMADIRPYWMYDAVNDSRTRPSHAAMDGKVFRADDPIWETWYPPNGFNCRCRVVSLSKRQVQSRGLQISEGKGVKVKPDEGFEYNPGKAFELDIEKYRKKYKGLFKINPEIFKPPQKIPQAISELKAFLNERLNLNIREIKTVRSKGYCMACTRDNEIRISNITFYNCNNFCPSKDLKNALKKMRKGAPLAFNEEYSLETLWHEILHSCQSIRDKSLLPKKDTLIMETFHQWRARLTYGELLQAFGYTPRFATKILNEGYGYDWLVKKARWLFNRLKLDARPLLKLSKRDALIKSSDVERYMIEKLNIVSIDSKMKLRDMMYDATRWELSEEEFKKKWEPFISFLLKKRQSGR